MTNKSYIVLCYDKKKYINTTYELYGSGSQSGVPAPLGAHEP